jgi:hypothetical protein
MTIEWMIDGREFANCNCSYGCPCQFNAPPTHGWCEAATGYRIETGRFGDVKLDGLCAATLYQWPGPVHKGNGKMQLIIDERADARQRDALCTIMTGGETQQMATMWWVFAAMCPTKFEPLFKPITLEIDIASRRGQLVIPGVVETFGEPIRNPVTGAEHRARIDLPNGFEYRIAEIGSGRTKARGTIKLELENTYAQFAELHLSGKGVVERPAA